MRDENLKLEMLAMKLMAMNCVNSLQDLMPLGFRLFRTRAVLELRNLIEKKILGVFNHKIILTDKNRKISIININNNF